MVSSTAKFYGSFFALLFENSKAPRSILKLTRYGTGFYLINNRLPVYLKYSAKRKGPWSFNFHRTHQQAHQKLFEMYGECLTCLICGKDGMVGLNMKQFRVLLDGEFENQECVSVRRKLHSMYQVKGRDGELERRLSRLSIFDRVQEFLDVGVKS